MDITEYMYLIFSMPYEFKCEICGKRLVLPKDTVVRYTTDDGKSGIVCEECSKKLKNAILQDLLLMP